MIIPPAKRIRGSLVLPGDKSISHRAAMVAALADGRSRIENYSTSADCAATLSCLQQLGVRIERAGNDIRIDGCGADGLYGPAAPLDCGNSGTTMRLLAGILAGQNFTATLMGDNSLRARPMQRIIEPLQMMGASVASDNGRAPLIIQGNRPLRALEYVLLVASAQVKSSILLGGLSAAGRTEVIENEVTRDHTERMLRWFGVPIETGTAERVGVNARFAAIQGPVQFKGRDVLIPGDISSAAYFIAAAALLPGSSLEVSNVGVNPTRILFLKQLRALGLDITITDSEEKSDEPFGTVRVRGLDAPAPRTDVEVPFILEGLIIPQLIDELPLLAVVGSQIKGGMEVRGAAELRMKESDRIATTVANLRAMGADVEEFEDGLRVRGATRLHGAKIDPRGDHRIAMAFTVAALLAEGKTEIEDAGCVGVSFPEFFELLESVLDR